VAPKQAAAPGGPRRAKSATDDDEIASLWHETSSNVARRMLTSATRCFAAKGYHATTTRDISAGAGLSPAAMYVHFPAKELVLYEITLAGHRRVTEALELVEDETVDEADDEARVRGLVTRFVSWHARHHVIGRVCQYELSALTPEHLRDIVGLRQHINGVFRDVVGHGVASGAFVPVDVNRVVRGIVSLAVDVVRWYSTGGQDSPEELGDFYADLSLRMLTGSPGTSSGRKRQTRPTAV
jgi:AcrR family transcriptional regulator